MSQEQGKQPSQENTQSGQIVSTVGNGTNGGAGSSHQPVGGKHVSDSSQFSQEALHPGMNPDPVERGRQLGHKNAHGGHSVGTGGHRPNEANLSK